ncbi:hypothetical protein RE428_14820 [Marinobacter nanhaiticus D15-8W]|nr:hypothetical protein RE428_14820 [Marinobacter nanhaiticus D15-8W]
MAVTSKMRQNAEPNGTVMADTDPDGKEQIRVSVQCGGTHWHVDWNYQYRKEDLLDDASLVFLTLCLTRAVITMTAVSASGEIQASTNWPGFR